MHYLLRADALLSSLSGAAVGLPSVAAPNVTLILADD